MHKEGINSYKKAYAKIEEGLAIKGEASSTELLSWLIANYNINSLNITTKGITFHLKNKDIKSIDDIAQSLGYFIRKKSKNSFF